jgi:glycosyltransferase involved in cell wall biosynthesis
MKVLVLNNAVPFSRGGAEELADHLVRRLNTMAGVQAELMRLPFNWLPSERLIDEILLHRCLKLTNVDRVIALKFPAYLVPHPNKVLWLLHQFRQAYDLDEVGQGLEEDERGRSIKQMIWRADNAAFDDCKSIYVNSPVTQSRLKRYNGFDGEVLYPPLNDAAMFGGGEAGDYVFAGGRVGPSKRQHLLIEAMASAPSVGRLLIAGPPESDSYADHLRELVAKGGLEGRVELRFGFHPREQIAAWVNGALACAYLPYDEDSLGYVTMEAFAAAKPVLTTTDSGGLLELVTEATGVVSAPEAASIAGGLEQLASNPARTRALGLAARAAWTAKAITWDATLERLLA